MKLFGQEFSSYDIKILIGAFIWATIGIFASIKMEKYESAAFYRIQFQEQVAEITEDHELQTIFIGLFEEFGKNTDNVKNMHHSTENIIDAGFVFRISANGMTGDEIITIDSENATIWLADNSETTIKAALEDIFAQKLEL